MIRRFFEKRGASYDLLSAEEFHGPITAFMDESLGDVGFVSPKQGVWVREDCTSGRPMFVLRNYKGKESAVVWGFALNYVPHFNSAFTKLYWHRTVKSARIDVFPFDDVAKTEGLSRFATPEIHAVAVESVLNKTIDLGGAFFDSHRTVDDLPPLFDRLRKDKRSGLGYWNYTNIPLAHAFTLRVLGDHPSGRRILEEYASRHGVSGAALTDLNARFDRAEASAALF